MRYQFRDNCFRRDEAEQIKNVKEIWETSYFFEIDMVLITFSVVNFPYTLRHFTNSTQGALIVDTG